MSFRLNNLQEVLAHTQLVQRMQNIMQEHGRVQQQGLAEETKEQTEIHEETIEETQESLGLVIAEEEEKDRYIGHESGESEESEESEEETSEDEQEDENQNRLNPPGSGSFLDITV